ncbi:1-deoxy-D-xylulose-5-phosphate reductoisomerase [bacterium]|nr:1-deoxy-D-xylulose-5-phosphate reductoisomerase [bacterium]
MKKRLVVFGATGSIGTQTLDVVEKNPNDFDVLGLSAKNNLEKLKELAKKFNPTLGITLETDKMMDMVNHPEADMVVFACSGADTLEVLLQAIRNKKQIAIANKELIVEHGEEIMREALLNQVTIVPIDSEHSGIFQILQGNKNREIEKIILTCSGGPFLNTPEKDFKSITFDQAIKHPNWNMGKKISVDSATMMNKSLEIIEAHYLFGIEPEKIEVLIHPQSIVHALVQFTDGSLIAHMGYPDMRIPISYALYYPQSPANDLPRIDLTDKKLEFLKPDTQKFPSINFAYRALELGGDFPKRLNRANEEAVNLFEKGELRFDEIFKYIEKSAFLC